MLKTSGGGSLVVGSLVGVTAAVVAISLLRHVSSVAKFDTLYRCYSMHFTHTRL